MTFQEFLLQKQKAPSTVRLYARIADRIGEEAPSVWLEKMLSDETPPGTVQSYFAAALLYWEFSKKGPRPVRPRMRKGEVLVEALSPTEILAFRAQADTFPPLFRDVFLLILDTGLRIHEVCNLIGASLVEKAGAMGVNVVGKGNKVRWIPLTTSCREMLLQRFKASGAPRVPLFKAPSGGRLTPDIFRNHWNRIRGDFPFPTAKIHPHLLRHTALTRLLSVGNDLEQVRKIAGHSSILTTQRYIHASPERLIEAVRKLDTETGR